MILIGWPFDSNSILNINDKTDGNKEKTPKGNYISVAKKTRSL